MEEQVPESQAPVFQGEFQAPASAPLSGYPDFEAMKAQARELAVQQVLTSKGMVSPAPVQSFQKPEIVYVRRNLTVAELIVVFAIACGIVFGIPALWNFAASRLPQIEIKVK
jgi:hypothetical protein